MRFDVTQDLRQPVGLSTTYELTERLPDLGGVAGIVNFMRTDKGLLVKARLQSVLSLLCSRCLREIESPAKIEFSEEYVSTVDVDTGEKLAVEESEDFLIDSRQTLDLTEAIRQYSEMVKPIQPLCRPDCAGLCPNCGADLNLGPCNCSQAEIDARWESLEGLAAQLNRDEGR